MLEIHILLYFYINVYYHAYCHHMYQGLTFCMLIGNLCAMSFYYGFWSTSSDTWHFIIIENELISIEVAMMVLNNN